MSWIFAAVLLLSAVANGARFTLNEKVIVQLFDWRWADIALECEEFLAPYGFGGVQISPPNENLVVTEQGPRPWWERYQPVSYNLTTRSGTEDELKDMLRRCNNVGIRIFADVVPNHMTGDWSTCVGTGGSKCNMKTLEFPIFSYNDFHVPECDISNYQNPTEVRVCKLINLHDLNQTRPNVRTEITNYFNTLITYGVAGFRVDSAKHIWPADLKVIFGAMRDLNTDFGFEPNTQALVYQEVIDMTGTEGVHYYEYTDFGLVTDFRYGNEIGRCFEGGNALHWLVDFGEKWGLMPANQSIVFIDNHDTERGDNSNILTYKRCQEYKMALAYLLSWGYSQPKILSSFDFSSHDQGPPHDSDYNILSPRPIVNNLCSNGWNCQHRWRQVYNMVQFHNVVSGEPVSNWWTNANNQIAFSRGNKGFIAFNRETGSALSAKLQTGLPEGTYCDVISGNFKYSPCTFSGCGQSGACTGKSITVDSTGFAQIDIAAFNPADITVDGVAAYHIQARLP